MIISNIFVKIKEKYGLVDKLFVSIFNILFICSLKKSSEKFEWKIIEMYWYNLNVFLVK